MRSPIYKWRKNARWLKYTALFLAGIFTQFLFTFSPPVVQPIQAQEANSCAITTPLSPEDEAYARSAWNYFVDNTQIDTGLSNSAGGFPSGTLWDLGNYLAAMNAARWMGFIDQAEFDQRINQFLTSLGGLRLFEDTLPNKVYNSATGEMVDYGNNPIERGIGWSALDIGRILAAFHIVRTCHPQYGDWMQGILDSWNIEASLKDDMLYGAAVLPDDSTLLVQEGRLGYEEYAARGYQLWGYRADKALAYEPFEFVDIYGLQIPVDKRAYQETNANNYVVSESYILDAIEFGLSGEQADYARRVYEAQKRRYEDTGLLTAVSEDNINGPPYFLYSTVYSNGEPWAVITENNELYPEMRTLSTKAAIGWHIVYPDEPYAKQLFDRVKDACNSGRGYFAGIFESKLSTPPPAPDAPYEVAKEYYNNVLTGNTNGIITEMFYYKARGNRPLIGGGTAAPPPPPPAATTPPAETTPEPLTPPSETAPVSVAPDTPLPPPPVPAAPDPIVAAPAPEPAPEPTPEATPIPVTLANQSPPGREIAMLPPVGPPQKASCPVPRQDLSVTDERYARNAWKYFDANYHPSGLVDDRSDLAGTTMWGVGDYLSALHAAQVLGVIPPATFDERVRHSLASLREMDLFDGELPHRAYDTNTLDPIDYGGNVETEGGWSGLDVGRVLAALHTLKTCHPEYTDVVDQVVLDWSYLRVVRDGRLGNAVMESDDRGRSRIRVYPTPFLGYEEYAARGFQLWGFDVGRSDVGEQYETETVEGQAVPVRSTRHRDNPDEILNTVSNPFILYGLEFGFDPEMRSLVDAIFHAEEARYNRTGTFSASGTTLTEQEPYIVHSTLVSNGQDWQAVTDDGQTLADKRVVSTAIAFAYYTLYPDSEYSQDLWRATLDLYNPVLGYYEGFYEDSGRTTLGFSSGTNSLILQALLHKATDGQPLIQPHRNFRSAWWDAVEDGYSGQGLPDAKTMPIQMTAANGEQYWVSTDHPMTTAPIATPDATTEPLSIENQAPGPSSRLENGVSMLPNSAVELMASRAPPDSGYVASTDARDQTINPLSERDRIAAERAWVYFQNNRQPNTGMVNAVDQLAWTTLWDQGSAILAIHAGRQLDLLSVDDFQQWMDTLLHTLETQPLPETGLPNKAYGTALGDMRTLNNEPDPEGTSGWSALDMARYLLSLKVIETHYPEYGDRIHSIMARYDLDKLVQDGWLIGGHPDDSGMIQSLQEGRLGYEQYAAHSLFQWDITATNALYNPPTKNIEVDGFSFDVDQRNLDTSGASNYLTSDPYTLWGMELGWPDTVQPQVDRLLAVQQKRFESTGILTAVNEDSLDRPPHFLYYSIYANKEPWSIVTPWGTNYPDLRFLSTKASFAWHALKSDDTYTLQLRNAVQNLADTNRGYFSGQYENSELGPNRSIDINTNAIVLESLLYKTNNQSFI